jgi:hypothetical protein
MSEIGGIFGSILRATFLNPFGIQMSEDCVTGVFIFSSTLILYLLTLGFISLSLVYSIEIIKIVKSPFSASISDRFNYCYWSFLTMAALSPVVVTTSAGRSWFFQKGQDNM